METPLHEQDLDQRYWAITGSSLIPTIQRYDVARARCDRRREIRVEKRLYTKETSVVVWIVSRISQDLYTRGRRHIDIRTLGRRKTEITLKRHCPNLV